MRKLGVYDRLEAAVKHLPEIITAMEHGDKARAESHADIIRAHLREAQDSIDDVLTKVMQELGSK